MQNMHSKQNMYNNNNTHAQYAQKEQSAQYAQYERYAQFAQQQQHGSNWFKLVPKLLCILAWQGSLKYKTNIFKRKPCIMFLSSFVDFDYY